METQTPTGTQPGADPAVAEQSAAAVGAQSATPGDIMQAIEGMDPGAIAALLDGNVPPTATVAATPEQNATQVATVDETTQDGAQPPAETTQAETQPGDDLKSMRRLSVRGIPPEQQNMLADALRAVRNGEAPDVVTAIRQLAGEPAAAGGGAPGADEPGSTDATPATEINQSQPSGKAELLSKIADLRAQRKQATLDYDAPTIASLTDQIEDLMLEVHRAEAAETVVAAQVGDWQRQHDAAIGAVESKYADALADPDSGFAEFLDNMVVAARASEDPALADPNFIVAFADKVASRLGIRPSAAGAVPRVPSAPTAPPAKASRQVGSTVAPGHTQAPRFTPDQMRQLAETAPIEAVHAALFDR